VATRRLPVLAACADRAEQPEAKERDRRRLRDRCGAHGVNRHVVQPRPDVIPSQVVPKMPPSSCVPASPPPIITLAPPIANPMKVPRTFVERPFTWWHRVDATA
jgi:hypothetical protein